MDDLGEAEMAFAESNIYNSQNAMTWAYLVLICIRTGRAVEAEQAYKYCLNNEHTLSDPTILGEIRAAQDASGIGNAFVDV